MEEPGTHAGPIIGRVEYAGPIQAGSFTDPAHSTCDADRPGIYAAGMLAARSLILPAGTRPDVPGLAWSPVTAMPVR